MKNKFLFYLIIQLSIISFAFSKQIKDKADSLFDEKKYTEAFVLYDSLYNQDIVSPAMLMKMAFIKEGLGEYVQAIYYLDHYEELTGNEKAHEKIMDIAEKHQLKGYAYNDIDFLKQLIWKYNYYVIFVLTIVGMAFLIFSYSQKKKGNAPLSYLSSLFIAVLFFGLSFSLNNHLFNKEYALIINNKSLIMAGPSAGAELLSIAEKGHKVKVISIEQHWAIIEWHGSKGYIRVHNLQRI